MCLVTWPVNESEAGVDLKTYLPPFRLQNSRIFCERKRHGKIIFKRKVWSECRNGEGEWGETRFTREDHAYGTSRLPKMEENDCFQEPITGSVQLTYFRATAFSQVRLFLDTPFPRISFQKPIRSGA